MNATKQHRLIEALIGTKKHKHGTLPKVGDAIRLIKKLDATVWGAIDRKFETMVAWCEKKDLL
jgi:hypothetical protein